MSKHTEDRLMFVPGLDAAIRTVSGVPFVLRNIEHGHWRMQEANSARVVACWNSCLGISTAALEAGVVQQLLAACEAVLQGCVLRLPTDRPGYWEGAVSDATVEQLRAAVALAKGETDE